jgi:ribosomal subunit interface protein
MHGAHVDECGAGADAAKKLAGLLHPWTTPTQITYRHTAPSTALTALIHQQVTALEEFKDRIVECRVVIDEPNQHHRAKRFRVEVILLVPGAELVASADPSVEVGQDAYAAVHEAFHSIRRQLVDHLQRARTHQS